MRIRLIITAILALAASLLLDRWAYQHVVYAAIYDKDLGRLLRVMGFWPTWAIAAVALWLHDRSASAHASTSRASHTPLAMRRALLLAGSPAVAGIVGELLKLVFRRERPEPNAGAYAFRAFSERPFSTGGLALPSTHTIVAVGAAAMLAHLFPRARWVWYALAAGCALTRVLAHAHFLSDVVLASLVAIATTEWVWRRYGRALLLS